MTLYSTPTCPKCKVVKMKLEKAGISYESNQSVPDMEKLGISQVPVLELDTGELLPFSDIMHYIREVSK